MKHKTDFILDKKHQDIFFYDNGQQKIKKNIPPPSLKIRLKFTVSNQS